MIEFGMPTLIENRTLEENIALCKELGLSFIELKTIEALKKSVEWVKNEEIQIIEARDMQQNVLILLRN